jgi:hypothetical protein
MIDTAKKSLLTIHERTFLQLLEGRGTVDVNIERLGRYFVLFVYFTAGQATARVPQGVILRNGDMLATQSIEDLLNVLNDLTAGAVTKVNVSMPELSDASREPCGTLQ